MKTLHKNLFRFSIIISTLVSQVSLQACTRTEWSYEDTPCPKDYAEVYKDFDPYIVKSSRTCCVADTEEEKFVQRSAPNCRVTQCLAITSGDLCSTLDHRFINNTKLEYEEVMRDPCKVKGTRDTGVIALCCQPNSTESMLVTTLAAEENEFPHQAKLKLPGHCGGTVYNERYIITAAHCVVTDEGEVDDTSEMEVILGTNIADIDSKEYIYKVRRVIVHPQYGGLATSKEWKQRGQGHRLINDIALLELDRKIRFTENIKSLEIASPGFDPFEYADSVVVVGWGTTDTLALTVHLQKANFALRSDNICRNIWVYYYADRKLEDKLLCIGGILEGKWSPTAGAGDSGGPAICRKENGHPVLCGVTSFGADDERCAIFDDEDSCLPSVYTEVERFHRWIRENAGGQNESTLHRPYLYGRKVDKGKYRHQMRITSKGGKACGGTLIKSDIVVTAAQCIFKGDGNHEMYEGVKVKAGVYRINDTGVEFGVLRAKYLKGYQRHGRPVNLTAQGQQILYTDKFHRNDLAILRLNGNVTIEGLVFPELPEENQVFEEGVELAFPRNLEQRDNLLERNFTILDAQECQNRMNRLAQIKMNVKVGRNVLCGVEKYSGGSTCDRELGGGLICQGENGKEVLCGVQVFRLCMFSIPNGFVNVAMYSSWIRNAINELQSLEQDKPVESYVLRQVFSNIMSMFSNMLN